MANLLTQGLLGIKAFAEFAAKKVEEADLSSMESKTKGIIDLDKARQMVDLVQKQVNLQSAAIDQLQQRVSNLEALTNKLELKLDVPIGVMKKKF